MLADKQFGEASTQGRSEHPEIEEEAVARFRVAVMRIGRWLRAASAEEGLTPAQSGALATLVREGPMRPGDLAVAEALNPTMLSRVAGHLAEAGLLERTPDPDDGRASLLRATEAGARLIARLRARRAALLVERVRELGPERTRELLRALPALEALADATERAGRERPLDRAEGRVGA